MASEGHKFKNDLKVVFKFVPHIRDQWNQIIREIIDWSKLQNEFVRK
jgi:hypothetical protein